MNRLKWQNCILVNGQSRRTDYAVAHGDTITVLLQEPEADYPAQDGPLTVLYEDEHILAVDKPAGMLIHPSRSQFTDTLANYVLGYYRRTGQESAFHPITRLDRDTFGIVLLAKNPHVHALLQAASLQKTYHALVYSCPAENTGIIDAPIARRPLPSLLRYVNPKGKPSLTEYTLLESYVNYSKLTLQPITGRTHQLRVHCAHMGIPILGDPQYGSQASQALSAELGYSTQQLCAKTLEFPHPITGQILRLESKMEV